MALAWIVKIGKEAPEHWAAAKGDGFWDVRRASAFRDLKAGDHVFFWLSGGSFVSWVRATSALYPLDDTQPVAHWTDLDAGGYTHRFDFEVISDKPMRTPAWNDLQTTAGQNYAPPAPANPIHSAVALDFLTGVFGTRAAPVDVVHVGDGGTPKVEYALGEDLRERATRAVTVRRGQPNFRRDLVDAYDRRCAVTGSDCEPVLEAAHIDAYYGIDSNHVANGLLLRSDLHTLFDLNLWTVSSDYSILISPELVGSEYADLHGNDIRLPSDPSCQPSVGALRRHRERCAWLSRGSSDTAGAGVGHTGEPQ